MGQATSGKMRQNLLKVAGVVRVTVREVWVAMCSTNAFRELYPTVAERLKELEKGASMQVQARASPTI